MVQKTNLTLQFPNADAQTLAYQKVLNDHIEKCLLALCFSNEGKTRFLLEHWVSELEPSLALDDEHNIIGLCPADAQIGDNPFILRLEDLK